MKTLEYKGKVYEIDEDDFLAEPDKWDENFAEGMASRTGITGGLTDSHWMILRYIRKGYAEEGKLPMVYKTCQVHKLRSADLAKLFPEGYRRGACKLAGLSYLAEDIVYSCAARPKAKAAPGKVYRVNVAGFLVDPSEWDEDYAAHKMVEMKMTGPNEKQCLIIHYLRDKYAATGKVPTVYETCADNGIEIGELGELFPDGYHRGAVKLAGLQ